MKKPTVSKKWFIPLALLLVVAGVSLGLGVQRLASESPPKPGTVLRRIIAPLAELQNHAPFTLYAPTDLPAGFVEIDSVLRTEQTSPNTVATRVETRYRHPASGSDITVAQTNNKVHMREDRVPRQVGRKTVWFLSGETYGRPDLRSAFWQEGDVYIWVGVMLKGGMTESDIWPIIASFAPVPPAPRPVLAPTRPAPPPPTPITPPAETPAASPSAPAPATPGPQSTAAPAEPPTPMPYPPITPVSSGQ